MFASNTLSEHILRGAIGIAALGYAWPLPKPIPGVRSRQGRWRCWRFAAARSAGPSACSKPQGSNGAGGRFSIVESAQGGNRCPKKAQLSKGRRPARCLDGVLADDGNVGTGADPVYRLEKL